MEQYICPKCRGHLRINNMIIFSTMTLDKKYGLIIMNPRMGNYSYVNHPSFEFLKGELVDFFCPICHANLEHKAIHENLARIIMVDGKNKEHEILFSRRAGEQCTFKIKDNKIESFGRDSTIYFESLSRIK
ncbi:MAG: hypothetical protein A2W91_18085 [Bacteroidetes bacterium GWF2_38_335]|nr:MAG: hypothetical protein A2W91_18085 [Bacteroidetes bacterium GWF2_38_335]OFY80123.1 MAG: hypothetical protein A2281_12555 [Bacteroidetes bacterium RIFOXYA12_FULL_38_20]HBS88550.1 hypothetical protein [Bacteroidales bacterium]